MDRVRVFRIIMYEGDRQDVERTIAGSLHGTKIIKRERGRDCLIITANTLGEFPEILTPTDEGTPA